MLDNIKINKPLPPLSSTKRVNPMGGRQNKSHQNLSKENFKKRQKKENNKEDPMHVNVSPKGAAAGRAQHTRHVVTNQKSKAFSPKKIIDIRV